ncbi:MAG: exo-alpha-sialidase [Gemmatimonadetes bacterium]|nr:exo-alpha-sialidase [Gemmatimonadota bacterium]
MANGVVLLVGTTKGAFFFHSDAERREWRMTGSHLAGWEVYSLFADERRGPRIYAGTSHWVYGTSIRTSDDLGETWTEVTDSPRYPEGNGFKLQRIWQIAPGHPSEPETLFAGVEEAGLFVSRDAGESWSEVSSLTQHPTRPNWFPGGGGLCLHTILVDPANPSRWWVAMSAVGVFRSDDGGASWQVRNAGLPGVATGQLESSIDRCVHKMVLDPHDSNTLYLQFHGGVFRSSDGADSWERMEEGLPSVFGFPLCVTRSGTRFVIPLESDEQRVVKEGRLRVYRSGNGSSRWEAVGEGLPREPQYVGVLRDSMAVDALEPAGVYFGTTMGEVFYSADEGERWDRLPAQLPRITTVKSCLMH